MRAIYATTLLLLALTTNLLAQPKPSQAQWQQDIDYLSSKVNKTFAAFTPETRTAFNQEIANLRQNLGSLEPYQILARLSQAMALLNDGHTELNLQQQAAGFRALPIVIYSFQGITYIVAANQGLTHLLGARVTRIAGTPIDEVYQKLKPYCVRDYINEVEYILELPNLAVLATLLKVAGLVQDDSSIEVEVITKQGKTVVEKLTSVSQTELAKVTFERLVAAPKMPAYRQNLAQNYFYTVLEKEKAIHLVIRNTNNQDDRPALNTIVNEVFEQMDKLPSYKLIVDFRYNKGGNYHKASALQAGLKARPTLQAPNRVFVLTDRRTFSAAVTVACQLATFPNTSIVGEPSRKMPNGSENYELYTLPNCGVKFGVTNKVNLNLWPQWRGVAYLPLTKEIQIYFKEFENGEDPVLAFCLAQ